MSAAPLLEAIFPPRCVFCGAVVAHGQAACPACAAAAARVEPPFCPRCGRGGAFCACGGRRYAFSAAAAPFYYEGAVKTGVARFKFRAHRAAGDGFAALALPAAQRLLADWPADVVTAVPMHRAALAARGYNQAALFGRALARRLGLPYAELLKKPFAVKPQHTCAAAERWGNVFGTVEPRRVVNGLRVLLADDIFTTGATLHECARVLTLAGAAEVRCITVACVRKKR